MSYFVTLLLSLTTFHHAVLGEKCSVLKAPMNSFSRVMNSIYFSHNRYASRLHGFKLSALSTMFTLLFGGVLQAGNQSSFNHAGVGKTGTFIGGQEAAIKSMRSEDPTQANFTDTLPRENYHLSLGSDLVNAMEFNYTEPPASDTALFLSRSDSPEWYRTTALFLGTIMVMSTFYLALSSLLKCSHGNRIPTGIVPGN